MPDTHIVCLSLLSYIVSKQTYLSSSKVKAITLEISADGVIALNGKKLQEEPFEPEISERFRRALTMGCIVWFVFFKVLCRTASLGT